MTDEHIPFDDQENKAFISADESGTTDTSAASDTTNEYSEQPLDEISEDSDTALTGQAEDPYEGALPPGYDWPTHGGYLGCLISLMASCIIGGFLSTVVYSALNYWQIVPLFFTIPLTIIVYLATIIGIGRIGWLLGKRYYREYPQKHGPTWGESDEYTPALPTTLAIEQSTHNAAASQEH